MSFKLKDSPNAKKTRSDLFLMKPLSEKVFKSSLKSIGPGGTAQEPKKRINQGVVPEVFQLFEMISLCLLSLLFLSCQFLSYHVQFMSFPFLSCRFHFLSIQFIFFSLKSI